MRTGLLLLLSLALGLAMATPAHAIPIYMQFPGVTGGVTETGHQGEVGLADFSLSEVTTTTTSGTGRLTSIPKFDNMSADEEGGSASVQLLGQALFGAPQTVKVFALEPPSLPDSPPLVFAEWDLSNASVTSFSTIDSWENHFTLNFSAFTYKWTNYDGSDNVSGTVTLNYDLATGQGSISSTGDTSNFALVSAVPEPASAGVLAIALPLLLRRRRRSIAL